MGRNGRRRIAPSLWAALSPCLVAPLLFVQWVGCHHPSPSPGSESEAGWDAEGGAEGGLDAPSADASDTSPEASDDGSSTVPLCEASLPDLGDAMLIDAPLARIPIQVIDSAGGVRFVVQLSVNGVPVTAVLDTGSPGLRIVAANVADAGLTQLDAAVTIPFNGGETLVGYEATGTVALDGLAIQDVPIQVVTSVCNGSDCDASSILGVEPAILGVSLRPATSAGAPTMLSPLSYATGYPPFFVQMYGDAAVPSDDGGVLQIGVTQADYSSFPYWVPLPSIPPDGGAPVRNDLAVRSCIRDVTADGACWTQQTYLDTGDPGPYIQALDAGAPVPGMPWSAGIARVTLLGQGGSCAIGGYSIPASSVYVRSMDAGTPRNNPGYELFYHFDVLYDPANARLGLRPK
jgi:hypothetical protein